MDVGPGVYLVSNMFECRREDARRVGSRSRIFPNNYFHEVMQISEGAPELFYFQRGEKKILFIEDIRRNFENLVYCEIL